MSTSDDRAIHDLRQMMLDEGLLPELPPSLAPTSASAERVLTRALRASPVSRRPSRLLAAAATLAVAVGGSAIWVVVGGTLPAVAAPASLEYASADPASIDEAAPAAMALAAAAQRAAASTATGDGEVQFVATAGWLLAVDADSASGEIAPTLTSMWLFPDGSAQVTQERGAALDAEGRISPGPEPLPGQGHSTDRIPPGTFDPELPGGLPLAIGPLRTQLLELAAGMQCGTDDEEAWCLADQIQQIYAMHVVPSDLAAAMWQVLAAEPAVRDLGTTIDRLGRPAHGVAVNSPHSAPTEQVLVLLASPQTGRLIGTETTTLHDKTLGISTPTVTGFQTWLDARLVNHAETVPSP